MSISPELRSADLRAITLDLVQLDILDAAAVGQRLALLLAGKLVTDRVSLNLVDVRTGTIVYAVSTAQYGSIARETTVGKLITKALAGEGPLIYHNIREHADLTALWADDYRTNACAVLPLSYRGHAIGALCISNLTDAQARALQVQQRELELFLHLVALLALVCAAEVARQGDERVERLLELLAPGA